MTAAPETTKPRFLYDDCCPMCKGYTAAFAGLGWAGREAFRTIDQETFKALDFERARHQIPLVDGATGEVRYGIDGILAVVGAEVPALKPILATRPIRGGLERLYWFITYNRRHIVTAQPPAEGIDCAPDYNPRMVKAYLAFTGVLGIGLGLAGPAPLALVGIAAAGTMLIANRRAAWKMPTLPAVGHVASTVVAAAGAGMGVTNITGNPRWGTAALLAVGARKLWLRRWMVKGTDPEWKRRWITKRQEERTAL